MSTRDPRWPNLFIVGIAKGGTTSLHRYLDQHPGIFMSDPKEPHYFDRIERGEVPDGDREAFRAWYLGLFDDAVDHPVRGDATPVYLVHPTVAERIHARVPEARIVMLLRDPIDRAYSHYWMHVAAGTQPASFEEAVFRELREGSSGVDGQHRYLPGGFYHDHVERYLRTFGEEQVLVLLTDDLGEDARGTVRRVVEHVGLDPGPVEEMDLSRENVFRGVPYGGVVEWLRTADVVKPLARALLPKRVRDLLGNRVLLREQEEKPPVPPHVRGVLAEVYGEDVARLEALIDRDLSHWMRP